MSTIEDLDITKLTEMSTDEAIEFLRQLRLERRTVVKKVSTKKPSAKPPKMSAEQAAELLKMLTS